MPLLCSIVLDTLGLQLLALRLSSSGFQHYLSPFQLFYAAARNRINGTLFIISRLFLPEETCVTESCVVGTCVVGACVIGACVVGAFVVVVLAGGRLTEARCARRARLAAFATTVVVDGVVVVVVVRRLRHLR